MGAASDIETNLRWFIESVADPVLVCDEAGRIVFANALLARLFGYSPEELISREVEELMPARSREAHVRMRRDYSRQPRDRPMGTGLRIIGLRRDRTEFPADIQLRTRDTPLGPLTIAVVRNLAGADRGAEIGALLASVREDIALAQRELSPGSPGRAALRSAAVALASLAERLRGDAPV